MRHVADTIISLWVLSVSSVDFAQYPPFERLNELLRTGRKPFWRLEYCIAGLGLLERSPSMF